MLDIYADREACKRGDLDNIALIRTQYNVADAMTKVPGNNALLTLLMTHKVDHPVVQFSTSWKLKIVTTNIHCCRGRNDYNCSSSCCPKDSSPER
jgi:hypothetical protein